MTATKTALPDTWAEVVAAPVGHIFVDRHEDGVRFLVMRGPGALCAYIGVPESHPLAGHDYDSVPLDCHGGLTFASTGGFKTFPAGWFWYGWDYGHAGDYATYYDEYPLAPTIPATFGLPGATSSASVALQRSLENKLRAQTDVHGSTWFTLTWKRWDTPSGRRLSVLLARARSTRGTGFGSLLPCPTPTAVDGKGSGRKRLERGMNNNLRDWFKINFNLLYPPVVCVRWLMGYPVGWENFAGSVTRSSRKSRRRS